MRNLIIAAVFLVGMGALAQDQKQDPPVVCVSTVADTTGKSIGPLGNLNDQLAKDITQHKKPLQGLAVPADITGHAQPSPECDYVLEIKLHVGGSTTVALRTPNSSPYDPSIDPRPATANFLVQAFYRLESTSKAKQTIKLEDDLKEQYEPNVGGYGTDVGSVAKRLAQSAAYNAAGRLKKKLKI